MTEDEWREHLAQQEVWIPIELLIIDDKYQRGPSPAHQKRMNDDPDLSLYDRIWVSRRSDGTYPVHEGGHRVRMWRNRGYTGSMPCNLYAPAGYDCLDTEEARRIEARRFRRLNGARARITPVQSFRAGLVAEDADCMAIDTILNDTGLYVVGCGREGKGHQKSIRSINEVESIYRWYDKDGKCPRGTTLRRALRLMREAFPDSHEALTSPPLRAAAVASFQFAKARPALDWNRLIDSMKDAGWSSFMLEYMKIQSGSKDTGPTTAYLMAMAKIYNHRKSASGKWDPLKDRFNRRKDGA